MIKRLFVSVAIITVVCASAAQATIAMLSDNATLTTNTFSTGTADLLVCNGKTCTDYTDSDDGFADTLLPGQTITKFFRLKNNSAGVDFSVTAQTVNESGSVSKSDVTIAITPIDSSDNPIGVAFSHTLSDWHNPQPLSLPNIVHGGIQRYKMDVTFSSGITATGSSSFDFVFSGTQTQ